MLSKSSKYEIRRSCSLRDDKWEKKPIVLLRRTNTKLNNGRNFVSRDSATNCDTDGSYRQLCVSPIYHRERSFSPVSSSGPKGQPPTMPLGLLDDLGPDYLEVRNMAKPSGRAAMMAKPPRSPLKFPQHYVITRSRERSLQYKTPLTPGQSPSHQRVHLPDRLLESLPESNIDAGDGRAVPMRKALVRSQDGNINVSRYHGGAPDANLQVEAPRSRQPALPSHVTAASSGSLSSNSPSPRAALGLRRDQYTAMRPLDDGHKPATGSPAHLPATIERDFESEEIEVNNLQIYVPGSPGSTVAPSSPYQRSDSGTSSHTQAHFVVVAIDFGTTYSGYAFSFTRDASNVHMMRKWDGGGDPDVNNHKTPTTLLLKADGEFHSFGFHARQTYHSLTDKEAKRWLYFEKFKMTLHTTQHLSRDTLIRAANGRSVAALTVFGHALRYFKQHAMQELSDQLGNVIESEDVRWVVTVPAIWKQPAKQFMRAAAYEATLASPDNPDQLLIALEPEAASVYCRKLRLNQLVPEYKDRSTMSTLSTKSRTLTREMVANEKNSSLTDSIQDSLSNINQGNASIDDSFTKGTRYMVVDCGGGTTDITVHEIQDKQGSLKELHKATGGPCGSLGVDNQFERLLGSIFGEDYIEYFRYKLPSGYIDLMATFEARKRSVNINQSTTSNVSLPFAFINGFKKWKGCGIETAVKKFASSEVTYDASNGMLRLQQSMVHKLFAPVTEEIVKHIKSVLANPSVSNVKYLFLVGGFAESQLLQVAVRGAFANGSLKVIIPQGVSLAILRGAVLFGLDPTIINIRRSRLTYGIGVLNKFIRGKHPLSKLIVCDNVEWCADVFDKFVLIDQSVGLGDTICRSYTPAKEGQTQIVLHVYSSDEEDAKYVTDVSVKRCGTLVLDLDEQICSSVDDRREIQTKMVFGDTELKVSAVDMKTERTVRSEIDFLSTQE
ncbi:Heat shock 70 kDa protein 12A [Halotydeus destructor]|nr:Heat shock 70 kDa protein 12A [Halotydeus destructor]